MALQNYHDTYGAFPPAVVTDETGRPMHSWRVYLLPFVEQDDLYRQYRFDEPWDSSHNARLMSQCPKIYQAPGGPNGCCDYRVVIGGNSPWQMNKSFSRDDIVDGLSNTIAVIEVEDLNRNWLDPNEIHAVNLLYESQVSIGGAEVILFDGSTHYLNETVSPQSFQQLIGHNDGGNLHYAN